MTVNPSIDPARLLEEQLAQASPDLLRELLGAFINTLLSAEARRGLRRRVRRLEPGADQPPQRLPAPRLRHPHRHPGRGNPQAPPGLRLPRVAPGATQARRTGADQRGRNLLPARRLDPPEGQARGLAEDIRRAPAERSGTPRPRPSATSAAISSAMWPEVAGVGLGEVSVLSCANANREACHCVTLRPLHVWPAWVQRGYALRTNLVASRLHFGQ
jgi:hypothetical protein